jgi:oligoribonuclease NrnB/cAMP/cGMP phosphodiesterase (DHH superfamily)
MKTLDKFRATSPPKRRVSRLKKFEKEILELYDEGYQVEQIQEFLSMHGIKVSVRAINKFKQNLSIKNSSLQTPSSEAAQNSKIQKTQIVKELKNDPEINMATKLFLSKYT